MQSRNRFLNEYENSCIINRLLELNSPDVAGHARVTDVQRRRRTEPRLLIGGTDREVASKYWNFKFCELLSTGLCHGCASVNLRQHHRMQNVGFWVVLASSFDGVLHLPLRPASFKDITVAGAGRRAVQRWPVGESAWPQIVGN
jgi:hypothetical protein